MMYGFAAQRRQLLEAEIARVADEFPRLGVVRAWVTGEVARGHVGPETPLELLLVHETGEPFHRRAEFFVDHLRPQLDTRYYVYTPDELESLTGTDRMIDEAMQLGEPIHG